MEPTAVDPPSSHTFNTILPYLAWIITLAGTAGSLFFSEIMDFPPCNLCWYQRVALYPLVIVIAVGIASADAGWKKYAWPLVLIGLVIAVYHNLLYYDFISEGITPCSEGVPCNARQLELFGFVTIPLMSLAGFVSLAILLALYRPEKDL
ncbi:MAG TPA: disulfide bond formation protein B [Pyrinomonadaceae bacterium]|nr:disulfide bond formation protein B [Pyrinomonadaceae bacterium]